MIPPIQDFLPVAVILVTLRRLVFLSASQVGQRTIPPPPDSFPSVTLLVPARDEAALIPGLLHSLSNLQYPTERLCLILISDGSTDSTAAHFCAWAATRSAVSVLVLPPSGKAAALNRAWRGCTTELVAVLDADLQPKPGFLRELIRPFADPSVGATAAFLRPVNADRTWISRYAAINSWVHQWITSAGRDRLGLNPPTLGAAAYRLQALEQVGGFPLVPLGEDVAISTALVARGWATRFVPTAIADNQVVERLPDFWRQLVRWGVATGASLPSAAPLRRRSWRQAIEHLAAAMGYADRVIFAASLVSCLLGFVPAWVLVLYMLVPFLAILTVLRKASLGEACPRFLVAAVCLFPVDAAAAATALVRQLLGRLPVWRSSERIPEAVPPG